MESFYAGIMEIPGAFAPLPRPMTQHLFLEFAKQNRGKYNEQEIAVEFFREFTLARDAVFTYADPYIRAGRLNDEKYSTQWFSKMYAMQSPDRKPISSTTRTEWEEKNLFHKLKYGVPDYDSLALIIARTLSRRLKKWLPTSLEEQEPRWWAWMKEESSIWKSCPIPLPESIPDAAIIVTSWPGAAWQEPWLDLDDNLGAVRFAGYQTTPRGTLWKISLDGLKSWQKCLKRPTNSLEHILPTMYKRIQSEADALLMDIAFDFFPNTHPSQELSYYLKLGGIQNACEREQLCH